MFARIPQTRQRVEEVLQNRQGAPSSLHALALTQEVQRLEAEFDEKVQPVMKWFEDKKKTLGERWPEGMFLAPATQEDVDEVRVRRTVRGQCICSCVFRVVLSCIVQVHSLCVAMLMVREVVFCAA